MPTEPTTTQLLVEARQGDRDALEALLPRVYDELRLLAHARLRRHRPGETLNTTALVHEAYLKLTAGETPSFEDRTHFFASPRAPCGSSSSAMPASDRRKSGAAAHPIYR